MLLWQVIDKKDALRLLYGANRAVVYFAIIDVALYGATVVLYIFARIFVTIDNFKTFQVGDWVLILLTLVNSFYGA